MSLSEAWNASYFGRYVKSHHISRTALVGAAFGIAILFFVIGAGLRLLVGPISLGPLSGQISDALDKALPGITVKYDQAAVEWSRSRGRVNLVVLGARVFDSKGRIVAQAPQMDIDLAAQPFIQGKIVVNRITLVGVQLTMVRNVDGTLRLGVEHDDTQRDIISRITDAINKNSSGATSLEAFAIRDARLAFMDEATGLFLVSPKAEVRISNSGHDLVASLNADVEISGRAAHITGEMTLPPGKAPVTGTLSVKGLEIAALGRNAKMFHFLESVAMTADFSSTFAIEGSHLLRAGFSADARGTAVLIGIAHPLKVRSMHVSGRYDRDKARIFLDDASLDSDQAEAHVVGGMTLVSGPSGDVGRLDIDLTADKTALAVPGTFSQPVFIPLVTFKGGYVPATHDILIEKLQTSGGSLALATSGTITLVDNKSPALELKGRIEPIAVRDLLHYWPLDLGEGAREWIDANVFSGTLGPIQYETHLPAGAMDLPALPEEAVSMTFPISNAEINYVHGLTHMTQAFGSAKLTGNSFAALVDRARVGPLAVSGGKAEIPDLSQLPGLFTARVQGSVGDVLRLTDMKPLGYAKRFGIDPATTTGQATVDLDIRLPMKRDVRVDEIVISVKAAVTGFGISLGSRTRLADGTMNFEVDNTHLHASGAVGLATSRVNVDWVEVFRTSNPVTTKVSVKGPIDQAGRAMLGIDLSDFLKGPVGVTATLSGHRGQLKTADMNLDLTQATLGVDLVGISKPAGFAATAHAVATFGPGTKIQTENMSISGPNLQATVALTFDDAGSLSVIDVPNVRSGMANDFAFHMTRGATGVDINIRGRSLDGSQFARRGSSSSSGPSGGHADNTFTTPFHIDAKLDRVMLRNAIALSSFALDVSGIADRPASLALSAKLPHGGMLTGNIAPSNGDRALTLSTGDMGTLAKGLFGFTSMKGGKLALHAVLHGSATNPAADAPNDYEGTAELRDFRLLDQPFLARLFSAGSLIGFGNLLEGSGIEVDRLKVPFSARNGVLSIHDARATGPAIGVSAEGYIDRPKNLVAIKGTLVPLFGINSVLGVLPVVGDLLVSKPGEGIIGMTYEASGDADEPKVSVNPLSIITPGIFRRIFEGKMPDAASAPSNNPPKPAPSAQKP
ncbi:MAG: AsmA-like C-terminal domain-containing protein [Proteobacteria bacterium]|nr:AsmA-like C-terminal domain-containing protein [Pseudomonadota bacterium]